MSSISVSPVNPVENGTAIINLEFLDEAGETIIVENLQWQLSDKSGTPISGMTFADNDFSGNQVVLTGDQLSIPSSDFGVRYFAVQGFYSGDAGAGLSIVGELKFTIQDLKSF